MKTAVVHYNEEARLRVLRRLNILDTPVEERFDRITRLAAQLFNCQHAGLSFFDAKRQWFKSQVNITTTEIPHVEAIFPHIFDCDDVCIIEDAQRNPEVFHNPFVIDAPYIRFYAGINIVIDGQTVGALSVFDPAPNTLTDTQKASLRDLAKLVESELKNAELTKLSSELQYNQARLEEGQKLTHLRSDILEKIVQFKSLASVLDDMVHAIEVEYLHQKCAILLLEGNRLRLGAAPSLPDFYNEAIDGLEIGIGQGSCGTTAFTNERTIVEDISCHPYWASWRDIALNASLRACWSQPIQGANGEVLGTFAIYHEQPAIPTRDELIRIQQLAHMASIAIERERANEIIWRQANFDGLTALPNRSLMEAHLKQAIYAAERTKTKVVVMFLDLDNFKDINDTLGHDTGDELLVECARRIENCIGNNAKVSRLGGDEFVVVLDNLTEFTSVEKVVQRILSTLSKPYTLKRDKVHTSASIGITVYPDDAKDITSLLKNADQAMYGAKAVGKNSFHYYTKGMRDKALKRMTLLKDLRYAIGHQQLFVEYQPIVDLTTSKITKAEALVRWQHPVNGLIRPDEFIPISEESGLIVDISNWVFRQVCADVLRWRNQYSPELQISINTSPVHYADQDSCITNWIDYMEAHQVPAQAILLEITEGLLMSGDDNVSNKLFHFQNNGVGIALDDFGTGYSSISYLKKYPTNYLKIDKGFVQSVTEVTNDKVLCEAIIVMAQKLGINVVAEGIETKGQYEMLKNMGCQFGQGYLFSKPLGKQAFETLLSQQ